MIGPKKTPSELNDCARLSRLVASSYQALSPIKAAVLPLVKKDGMPEVAREIYKTLKPHMTVFYDEKSAVGRRYRRQDEVGTPFCVTVDSQTLADNTVTIRDRDTAQQERVGCIFANQVVPSG